MSPGRTKHLTHQTMKKELTIEQLENIRSAVIEQIEKDISDDYYMAIYELLELVPIENLLGYLDEEIRAKFK